MLFRRMVLGVLLCVFCSTAIADDECPIGYSPAIYIQLEYIESTGTQYIDTGIKNRGHVVCELEYMFMNLRNESALFGTWESNYLYQVALYNHRAYFGVGSGTEYNLSLEGFVSNDKNFISLSDDGIFSFNGQNVHNGTFTNMGLDSGSIILFGRYVEGGVQQRTLSVIRVYSFVIKQGEDTLRYLIPVRRITDGAIGMLDRVEGKFYGNDGTGEFIAGPEKETEFMNSNICSPCPPNTYKDFVGNGECTPCPDAMVSPSGSKNVNECGRVMYIGGNVYHMKSVKQTSPSLNIMDEYGHVFYGNLYSAE